MANLETLELTINGSAEQASQGIDGLISRLSSLSKEIVKPYSDLRDFNAALKETAKLANSIKFKNLGKSVGTSAAKAANTVTKQAWKQPTAEDIARSEAINAKIRGTALPAEAQMAQQAVSKRLIQERMAATLAKRQAFEARQQAKAQAQIAEEVKNTTTANTENQSSLSKIKQGFSNLTEGASKFFSKVKRIATTMLIRAAIRGLIKATKEGINNFYEWSKLNNGEFAKSFDTLTAKGQQLKNSVGAAIAPAIQAAIPVINALANAAITAFNWVNQLIALLTGQNYWTKATDNVDAYTDSVNKAGGAAKEWLASFDELNVMTSGGGGGGGSGASGITSDMFENTSKFNETLKEITGFIRENFESIKTMAEGIGVAILSWKLSQAFKDTLPALSKVAGLIGIGATIGITLQADWLLTNEYLKTGKEGWLLASALTTGLGATVAGVIAKKIFNGKAAMATVSFVLLMSAFTDIVANVRHTDVDAFSKEGLLTSISAALKAGAGAGILLYTFGGLSGMPLLAAAGGAAAFTFLVSTGLKLLTSKDNIKWGSFEATQEQINTYVQQRMFDVKALADIKQIEVVNIKIDEVRAKINDKLALIDSEFNMIKLGVDKAASYGKINEYITGTGGLLDQVKELSDLNIGLLKVTFGSMQAFDGDGNPLSSDVLFAGIEGWNNIKNEMTLKGKELSELLVKGANNELTPQMEKYTQNLLAEVTTMMRKVTNAEQFASIQFDFQTAMLDAFSKNSFDGIIKAFNEQSDANKSVIEEGWRKVATSYLSLANYEDDPELKAKYTKMAQDIIGGLDKTVQEELDRVNAPGVQMIIDWIFGHNEAGSVNGELTKTLAEKFRGSGMTAEAFTAAFQEIIHNQLGTTKEEIEVWKLVGFTGWDLLSKDLKSQFLKYVVITPNTIKELKKAGVSAEELVELTNWDKVKGMTQENFIKAMTSAFGSEGISAIKQRFPTIQASQVVKFSAWDEFSNIEKLNFIDAIGKAFGANEAVNAAKQAGIDLEAAIREGMNSQNDDIKKTAKKWAELMGIEIRGGDYKITPTVDDNSKPKIQGKIATFIGETKGKVTKIDAEVPDSAKKTVKDTITGISAVVKPKAEVTQTVKDGVKADFETIKPTVSVTANANVKFNDIKGAFVKALGNVQSYLGNVLMGKITFKAGGGLVDSGDMFVANENGIPEMIGRFGNQTGVANTDQIVAGISRGVSEANDEQNYLLREQNALLRAILEKEGSSGIPGASAAFGRTVARSLDMYNGLVGGR